MKTEQSAILLKEIRQDIDRIDNQLIELLKQRSECVERVAKIKCENQLPIYDSKRENEILDEITHNNPTKYQNVDLANIFHTILRAGLNQQLLYRSEHEDS